MKKVTLLIIFMVFLCAQVLQAQTVRITGKVTASSDGMSVPGVQIVAVGTTIGVITDMDGNYSLEVPASATALRFSFVGMEPMVVDIAGKTVINVAMKEDVKVLGEVIVLGYSTRGKNEITGSTEQVSGEQLRDVPVTNITQTLQGKVAGMVINSNSGSPGATQNIRIRGLSSIAADNEPLYVIDGVPVINTNTSGYSERTSLSQLSSLNSNDIASITVLKDASATSAYGARGSNGVIVITTKKGKSGASKFNLNTSYGFQNRATPGRQVLTAAQREELYLEGVYNTYGAANGFTEAEAFDWALANGFAEATTLQEWHAGGSLNGDWEAATRFKNAPVLNINLAASGGDDLASFYTSVGYTDNQSIVIGNKFKRITGQLNYNRNFSKKVRFSTTNSVSHTFQDGIPLEASAYFASPIAAKYFSPPTYQPLDAEGNPTTNNPTTYNYLYLYKHDVNWNKMARFMTNDFVEWDIIDKLKFKSLAALDFTFSDYKSYQNRNYGDSQQEGGSSERDNYQRFNMVFQNSLDYRLLIMDNHRIDFKALIEYQEYRYNELWGYSENFAGDGLTNVSSGSANQDAGSSFSDWMNLSYLGMANYNYLDKYIVDLTFRREGSSRFAETKRFGNFWAVGAAWNMNEEAFLSGTTWIDNLRVRGSYGVSGNSGVGINSYQALLSFSGAYADQGAATPSSFGNPLLTWEKNKNYDIGVDFTFLDNMIDGSIAYFNKETFDLLQSVPLTMTSGHSSITQNIGSMVNKGVEAIVDFNIIQTSDFNLTVGFNLATLNNEITKLATDAEGNEISITGSTTKTAVGHPYAEWNMRKWYGVNPDNGRPQWYINGIDDSDGITENYNTAEIAFQGTSALPTYSGGASFHVDYKGVYFDMNLYFAGGHSIFESWVGYTWDNGRYATDLYNGIEDIYNSRWQKPGDVADFPMIEHAYRPRNSVSNSTRFLFDGTYARVKDLVLGYKLPQSIATKLKVSGIQVYARGTNMFTWVKDERLKTGFDPETQSDGVTGLEVSPLKSMIFGLNLNF
ncbi:MAG TPA: SusC/RagA family TonB-linked outer membrane protein [Bacteroidales bacterium]|nr:SusC/RagA family TonB-linked outer membrane protein [Bacteroidales bacterium]